MPDKLLNTLKYGSAETKRKIYLMLGLLAGGVIMALVALIFGKLTLGLVASAIIFVDGLILFNTSFEEKTITEVLEEMSGDYDEKKLKRLFVVYKVKKHHVTVLIDSCHAEKIVQTPAYLWKNGEYLYFLVLGEEARLVKAEASEVDAIHIRRGVPAQPAEEYLEMQENPVINMIFGELLPKYYSVERSEYRTEYKKNMYSAAPGVWCTAPSVKNIVKLLPEKFVLDDGKIEGESSYYQEIYIARLMYWDEIYSAKEYREKVLTILDELIAAQLAESTVTEYLDAMQKKGLIPHEYAEYVISKRKQR